MLEVRPIDGNRLAEIFEEAAEKGAGVLEIVYRDAAHFARTAPEIKLEVRHGRWIERQMDLICSVCKWEYSDELRFMSNHGLDSMTESFAYCPHCGADLREGGADNG